MNNEVKILVLDDDESMRMTVMAVLTPEEWNVDQAESAEEALELCKSTSYEVMLVDKNLPGKSGVEFVKEIRGQGSDASVIMISGYASATSAFEMVNLGIDAYIEKPVSDIFEIVTKTKESLAKLQERRKTSSATVDAALPPEPAKEEDRVESDLEGEEAQTSSRVCQMVVACKGADDLKWLSEMLSQWGEVKAADSSTEIYSLLQDGMPDLLILDYDVEDLDVMGLLSKVKSWAPDMVCLIILEKPSFKILSKLIDLEVSGVIEKPFDKEAVSKELSRLVDNAMRPE